MNDCHFFWELGSPFGKPKKKSSCRIEWHGIMLYSEVLTNNETSVYEILISMA